MCFPVVQTSPQMQIHHILKWCDDTDLIRFEWLHAVRYSLSEHHVNLANEKYQHVCSSHKDGWRVSVIIMTSEGQNSKCVCGTSNATEPPSQQLNSAPAAPWSHASHLLCLLSRCELIFNLGNALIKPGLLRENRRGMIMRQGWFWSQS